jgi:acetyltransferase
MSRPLESVIRPIRRDDAVLLAAFFARLGEQSRYWFHPHPFDADTATLLAARADASDEVRFMMTHHEDGREVAVAYGFLEHLNQDYPVLGIAVADDAHGQGLGRRMVLHLVEAARRGGKRGIQLTVYDDNVRARRLYEQCGFVTSRVVYHMNRIFDNAVISDEAERR